MREKEGNFFWVWFFLFNLVFFNECLFVEIKERIIGNILYFFIRENKDLRVIVSI